MKSSVPECRVRLRNDLPVRADGQYVLYWMIASRRANWNFALERAIDWSRELNRPLMVFEALRCGYRWASDRLHRFVIDGMRDNAAGFARKPVYYYPYVEPKPDAARGLLESLANNACVMVTDDFPTFFLPSMVRAVARKLSVKLEAVDTNGLFPMYATDRVFTTAHSFRRFLQKQLPDHLTQVPQKNPFSRKPLLPPVAPSKEILLRWPAVSQKLLEGDMTALHKMPIDHQVTVAPQSGGSNAASRVLKTFLQRKLSRYTEDRNSPALDGTTGLSPFLHFGHISAHDVFDQIMRHEAWSPNRMASKATGSRKGWWGCIPAAEALLDQLITWRELGYNFTAHRRDYDEFESLPEWALRTLAKHARDRREHVYSLSEFEQARTHDPLWNAVGSPGTELEFAL